MYLIMLRVPQYCITQLFFFRLLTSTYLTHFSLITLIWKKIVWEEFTIFWRRVGYHMARQKIVYKNSNSFDEHSLMDPAKAFFMSLKIPIQPRFRSLLPLFLLQLRACNIIYVSYFKWNEASRETGVHDSKLRRVISSLQRIILSTYSFVLLAYFLSPNSLPGTSTADKILGFVFIATFMETSLMSWIFYLKQNDVVLLWNSFLTFEKKYLPRKLIFICCW